MIFERAETDGNYSLARFVSKRHFWELGFHPVIFGVRFRMSRVGSGYCNYDLCGADERFRMQVLSKMLVTLAPIPETATDRELVQDFPIAPSSKLIYPELGEQFDRYYQSVLEKVAATGPVL